VGRSANTLPLRADLGGNPRFPAILDRIRETAEAARDQREPPSEEIVQSTQVTFAYDSTSVVNTLPSSGGVDLSVELVETGNRLNGRAEYRTDVFKGETVERMMTHFGTLLTDIVREPDRRLGEFELLPAREKKKILSDWNRTGFKYPQSPCVHSLFEGQAEKTPDKVAITHGNEALTYGELNRRANRLAHYLSEQGVTTETLVAVNLDLSFELVVGLLGILKAGGAYVPLDPTYPPDRLRMILEDCGARFLLTKNGLSEGVSDHCERTILVDRDWGKVEGQPDTNPHHRFTQDNLFYVTYTSGSTGRPKGVAGIHRGIINRIHWMWDAFPFAEDEVCAMKTSPSFVDHAAEIFCPLLKGIPLVVFSREEARDVGKTVDLIIEKGITRMVLVPSQLRRILAMRKEKVFQLTELRYVFCSGEALPVRLAKQFYQEIRNAKLVNIYGSTEVSADVTYYEVKRFHVDDVLKYFTQSVEFPGGLLADSSHDDPSPMAAGRVTTAGVSVDQVARRFTSSRITEFPITLEEYYKKLNADVLPYVINTAAPTFIGHMTSALPDFVHDLSKLISQLNQNLVKLETGKSLIFLEREALAILHRCFYEYPDAFYESNAQQVNMNLGLITTGGTTANVMALLTARNRALFEGAENPSDRSIYALLREKGYEDMTILGSRLMHYSMQKATSVLGLGIDTITYVDTDQTGSLDLQDLERKVEECRRKKVLVLAIVGIAGATETGRIEPLDEMGDLANSHGIHFHVDAAWGGTAILSDQHKTKLRGIEKADSITFCGHKQLYLPQGISVCLFRDPRQAQYGSTSATYQAVPDTYDVGRFTLEGSRSAISLVLHAALRLIGKKGYELLVDSGIEQARFFADVVKSTEGFELIGDPELNIVNYRYVPVPFRSKAQSGTLSDDDNRRINSINAKIQETQFYRGETFVSKTTLFATKHGKGKEIVVFRVVLSNPLTTQADIYSVLEDQLAIVEDLFGEVNEVSFDDKGEVSGTGWESAFTRKPVFVDEYQEAFVPIGKPLANCRAYILDKYGNPTPVGIPGELHVAGAAVSRGYFNMPDLTREVFVPDPFADDPDARMVKTGDRARFLHDGNIEYLGRLDDQVKIQGFRIEIAEVESALEKIEHVQQAAVVARSDAEGNKVLVAYIVPETGEQDMSEVRRTLAQKLPEYMVPSLFEVIEAMPLTPSGKTDKKALTRGQV
jgi:putative pyridoxal-dependent aspartate 1-decarboxylase